MIAPPSPPSSGPKPRPWVTSRICPVSCLCQWVRTPGGKNTVLIITPGTSRSRGSDHTVPVNVSPRSADGIPAIRPWLIFISSLPSTGLRCDRILEPHASRQVPDPVDHAVGDLVLVTERVGDLEHRETRRPAERGDPEPRHVFQIQAD